MELKDLPKPISREDIYKYAICNGLIDNLPKPLSRQDFYLMALITGDTEDLPKPISRLDIIMYNCIMGTMDNLPKPISRADYYWTAICTGLKNNIPEPISRSDYYDYYLALYSAFREWLEYRGETIQAECSRQAYIKDLKLEGNTYKNLLRDVKVINTDKITILGDNSFLFKAITSGQNYLDINFMGKPNSTYTIICYTEGTFTYRVNGLQLGILKSTSAWEVAEEIQNILTEGWHRYKFTTGADYTFNKIRINGNYYTGYEQTDRTIKYITILEGDYTNTELGYINNIESCGSKEGKINLSINSNVIEIPMELKGLPNGIKDTIEKINNVWSYVKRVDKIVLDGSEDWVRDQNKNGYTRFSIAFTLATCSTDENYAICDKYNVRHKTDLTYNDTEHLLIRDDMSKLYLKVVDSTDSITVTKFKESLSNNPVTVYYQLTKPVITPLSQELQEQLDRLQATKGSNIITTNSNVKANISCSLPV